MNIGNIEVDINDYLKVRDAFLYEKCGSHIVKRLKKEIDFYERENLNVSHLERLVADFLITRDFKTNGRLREWWQLSCKINEDEFKKLLEMSLFELEIFFKRPKNFYNKPAEKDGGSLDKHMNLLKIIFNFFFSFN